MIGYDAVSADRASIPVLGRARRGQCTGLSASPRWGRSFPGNSGGVSRWDGDSHQTSGPYLTMPPGRTMVLLGDSILDNAPYTGKAPDTTHHLQNALGPSWTVQRLAQDGVTIADRFEANYVQLAPGIANRTPRLVLCTVYEPPLLDAVTARLARVPLGVLNDRITQIANATAQPPR